MILVIDNYDSFTFNLVQTFGTLGAQVDVRRNDAISMEEIARLRPSHIVISPGPKTPTEAGISIELLRSFAGQIPILGVCLGCQAMATAYGGRVARAQHPMHGKTSRIHHDGAGVYRNLPNPFVAMRYHSLVVDESSLPDELVATAHADSGELMGLRHRRKPLEGVQFHPESYKTDTGMALLKNFLAL